MKKLFGLFILVWVTGIIGWCLNLYQLIASKPATFSEITPLWVIKAVCVPFIPGGMVMGFVGLFQ